MSTVKEIEAAIEKLPAPELEELAGWLEQIRQRRATATQVEAWLDQARGAAQKGATTTEILALTRGEE
jgi:hypothetical protein